MSLRSRGLLWILVLGAALSPAFASTIPSICGAVSGNVVQNCGFETGDFTSWTQTPAASGSDFGVDKSNNIDVNSGTYAAYFGATGSQDDTISQTLSTTIPGDNYAVSFYLANDGGTPANFQAYWDGVQIFSAPTYPFNYTQLSFNETALGSDTIAFAGLQNPAFYYLDDVVVVQGTTIPSTAIVPTPEPASILLLATGLLVSFAVGRRLQKSVLASR